LYTDKYVCIHKYNIDIHIQICGYIHMQTFIIVTIILPGCDMHVNFYVWIYIYRWCTNLQVYVHVHIYIYLYIHIYIYPHHHHNCPPTMRSFEGKSIASTRTQINCRIFLDVSMDVSLLGGCLGGKAPHR
jgi:hypothetical protein